MIATVIVVVATHNLALGVLTGVLLSALFLANKLENDIRIETSLEGEARLYKLSGQIFLVHLKNLCKALTLKKILKKPLLTLPILIFGM